MVLPSTTSPVTGSTVPSYYIHSSTPNFQDTSGRTLLLRGINLSSSAKSPQNQPGSQLEGFWERGKDGEMSFVNRVLDLDEDEGRMAGVHLSRLRSWGFNSLRYVVNWESIEHAGPGKYDQDYIDYTIRVLRKCKEYGFLVYIDPHQDLFSRFAGGSGAPYWTLAACGLNPENFTVTNAACIECEWPTPLAPVPSEFPAMIWASNYSRLACQTLFTLWFAGKAYAPKCIIDGVNIQDYLQEHYFNAMKQLGNAIANAGDLLDECVIGWDSLNEPNAGYLGIENLNEHGKESVLKVGPMPTGFQGMKLGMGNSVEVENWKFGPLGPKRDGSIVIDPKGKRAWMDPSMEPNGISPYGWTRGAEWEVGMCIWALHHVWDPELDELLLPDYFDYFRGGNKEGEEDPLNRKVDFGADYWLAHWRRWAPVVRGFHPEAIHFIQSPVFQIPPKIEGPELMNRVVHSSHFYDGLTLVTKHWNWFNADALGILRGKYASVVLGVKVGEGAIRKCLREQLGVLRQDTFDALGQYPTMMGEIGIPFDLDKKKAYTDGDYSAQTKALDASLNACDGSNALNYSIWTYCPDNSHQFGDQWNGEDLSLWSGDDATRMTRYRTSNSNSQLDFIGKISKNRSRANSRASTLSNSTSLYNSPNSSTTRLVAINPSISRLTNGEITSTAKNSVSPPSSPKYSALSLPELLLPNSVNQSNLTLGSLDPLLPINLNDGARAIAAFCRPYPTKSVGTPIDINFDIKTSNFTLSIKLDAGEVPDSELATEIFIPLIHYAAFPSRISQLCRNDLSIDEDFETVNDGYSGNGGGNGGGGGGSLEDIEGRSTPDRFLRPRGISLGSSPLSFGNEKEVDDPEALSLNVKISAGRLETEGQYLKWYYPRPTSGSVIYKIQISRMKGPIPLWCLQPSGTTSGVHFDATSNWFEYDNERSLWGQLFNSLEGGSGSRFGYGLVGLVSLVLGGIVVASLR